MKILTAQNPILRQKSKKVSKIDSLVLNIINQLSTTLQKQANPGGVGLAAVQTGEPVAIFIAKIGKNYVPFVNPEIKKFSGETTEALEGCLSVPTYYGMVKRSFEIEIAFLNKKGRKVTKKYSGFLARILQHETDHLNGVLFIDRVFQQKTKLYKLGGKDEKNQDKFIEVIYDQQV